MKKILVDQIIKSNLAVSPEKGEALYTLIKSIIEKGETITLDFKNINQLTTAFLNNAIGNLYREHTSKELNTYLKVTGLDELDKYLFSKVINRSKSDFKNDEELNDQFKGE